MSGLALVVEALRGMEAVAEHINEMQKIYEEYGHVFDELTHLYRESHGHTKVNISTENHTGTQR